MYRLLLIFVGFLITSIQSLTFPWLAIYGTPVQLAPVILLLCHDLRPHWLIPVSFGLGLGLDVWSPVPLGFWTLAFVLGALSLQASMTQLDVWWSRVAWTGVFAALLPIYALLSDFQPEVLTQWPVTIIFPAIVVATIAAATNWIARRRANSTAPA